MVIATTSSSQGSVADSSDYVIADIGLAEFGRKELTIAETEMPGLIALREKYGKDVTILECTLGNGKMGSLHTTHYPGCNSMFEPDPSIIDIFYSINTSTGSNFELKDTNTVQTIQLDKITPRIDVDYIKIDVQGSELNILKHGQNVLKDVLVIESEVEFLPLYKEQPLFGDIQIYLNKKGLSFHKFIDVASRCIRPMLFSDNVCEGMSQILWADAIFLRNFVDLDKYSNTQLLKAAYIMHDLYCSYDLVFYLLNAHDNRTHTSYSLSYAKRLTRFPELPKYLLNLKEFVLH